MVEWGLDFSFDSYMVLPPHGLLASTLLTEAIKATKTLEIVSKAAIIARTMPPFDGYSGRISSSTHCYLEYYRTSFCAGCIILQNDYV